MGIRTTSDLVKGIIEVDVAIDLSPFILAASALVDDIVEKSGHDADRLRLIETWLAAHFYTVRDPRTTDEKAGTVSASYQSAVDLNLNTSHYGQMAMTLDSSGLLRATSKIKRKVSVSWLGKAEGDTSSIPVEVIDGG